MLTSSANINQTNVDKNFTHVAKVSGDPNKTIHLDTRWQALFKFGHRAKFKSHVTFPGIYNDGFLIGVCESGYLWFLLDHEDGVRNLFEIKDKKTFKSKVEVHKHRTPNGQELARINSIVQALPENKDKKSVTKLKSKPQSSVSSYTEYFLAMNKVPNDQLYKQYQQDVKKHLLNPNGYLVTEREQAYINARRNFNDIVSATNQYNKDYAEKNKIKDKIFKRLKKFNITKNVDLVYQDCINFLLNNTVMTVTFRTKFFKDGLTDFQPLNMWEILDQHPEAAYDDQNERTQTEKDLFKHLPDHLKQTFTNIHTRVHYGCVYLLDRNTPIDKLNSFYGDGFGVLKPIAEQNVLKLARDSLIHHKSYGDKLIPSTNFHPEFLLLQCTDKLFEAIVTRVVTGIFPSWFDQSKGFDMYFEWVGPGFNSFNKNIFEHLHIESSALTVSGDIIKKLNKEGINFTNSLESPYQALNKTFMEAIESNQGDTVVKMLAEHPSLARLSNGFGYSTIHIAIQKNNLVALEALLKYISPNLRTPDKGFTPLHLAVQLNSQKACEILIEHGADLNMLDNNRQRADQLFSPGINVLIQFKNSIIADINAGKMDKISSLIFKNKSLLLTPFNNRQETLVVTVSRIQDKKVLEDSMNLILKAHAYFKLPTANVQSSSDDDGSKIDYKSLPPAVAAAAKDAVKVINQLFNHDLVKNVKKQINPQTKKNVYP